MHNAGLGDYAPGQKARHSAPLPLNVRPFCCIVLSLALSMFAGLSIRFKHKRPLNLPNSLLLISSLFVRATDDCQSDL